MQQQQQQQQLPGEVEAAITRVDEALALLTRIQLAQSRLVTQIQNTVVTPYTISQLSDDIASIVSTTQDLEKMLTSASLNALQPIGDKAILVVLEETKKQQTAMREGLARLSDNCATAVGTLQTTSAAAAAAAGAGSNSTSATTVSSPWLR